MKKKLHYHLSRRESQVMDIVFRLGEASAEDVHKNLPDPPSYNAVRITLASLEQKGQLIHRSQGHRYIYRPVESPEKTKTSVLRHVLTTFFGGSAPKAVATLLDMSARDLSREELDQLAQIIRDARADKEVKS